MLRAHFLNQGRVDSILLECDGEYAFIDGGYRRNGLKAVKYMQELGVTRLKYYIASHGHKNHIGAAAPIIEAFKPKIIVIGRAETLDAIKRFSATLGEAEAIEQSVIRYMRPGGSALLLGSASIVCIGPKKLKSCSTGSYTENYNSLILRVDYHGKPEALLTGDTSATIISKCGVEARARVLKNPHHAGSQPMSLLKQVKPEVVVICSNVKAGVGYRKRIAEADAVCVNVCEGRVII